MGGVAQQEVLQGVLLLPHVPLPCRHALSSALPCRVLHVLTLPTPPSIAAAQGLASLKLPPPVNETGDSVACVTEYGRSYYLTIQFTFLAFLVGMQVVGGEECLLGWGGDDCGWGELALCSSVKVA